MALHANKVVTLELENGSTIKAERALNYASGFLKDFLKTTANEHETVSIPNSDTYEANIEDFKLLNSFIKYADENLHDELRDHSDESDFWVEALNKNKENLLALAENASDDVVLRSINMGDFLIVKSFVMFCSLVLYERIHNLSLKDLRTRFNDTDDFDKNRRDLIAKMSDKL